MQDLETVTSHFGRVSRYDATTETVAMVSREWRRPVVNIAPWSRCQAARSVYSVVLWTPASSATWQSPGCDSNVVDKNESTQSSALLARSRRRRVIDFD